ncbi:MAG: glycosyltransferase family 4 protein [Novosphingobium sp.]
MHIGLCSPAWPPDQAANSVVSYVAAIRGHFLDRGHRVSILSPGQLTPSEGDPVPLHPSPARCGRLAAALRRVGRGEMPGFNRRVGTSIEEALLISPLDILETEDSSGWSDTVQRVVRVPVVTRLHGPHFLKPAPPHGVRAGWADRARRRAEGRTVRAARSLTAPTGAMMAATCAEYGRPASPVDAVIPSPTRIAPPASRWRLESCRRGTILMVGGFGYEDGADTMLMAFERLLQRCPLSTLTIVGPDTGIEITPGHTIGFAAYARASLSPEARERVTFAATQTSGETAKLRQQANVTVVASRAQSAFHPLLEGLGAGCPMITTDWPGSEEFVKHGETALVTPVSQPNPLADNLELLLAHPDVASRIGSAGRKRCAEAFSVPSIGDRILSCYRATLESCAR